MSNRIKTGRLSRRRPPLDHGPLSRPTRDVPPPSTGAGAHFRPARRHVKREQECEPLPAGFCFAQKKRCSLEQTTDSSVELLPPVSWGDAPRNPPPSAKNCLRFEFTKDLKIPPFLPGQVDFDGTLTSDHPRKVTVEKGETLLETRERGTKQWESTISLEVPCMPGPPDTRRDLDLASWKDSSGPTTVSEKVQVSQTSRLLEDHQAVPISHSQARSGPPLQKPDAGAGALPDLASDHLPLQEKLAKGVLDKIHLSSVPAPLVSGKEVQDAKTSHPPSRSCSSSIAPNKKTIKRKLLMPLPLPPPLLLPSLLPWGRNELPPPPKLPRILWEEDLGTSKCKCLKSRKILQGRVDTLKDNVEVLKDKVESLENKVEGLEDKVEALENKVRALENETKAKADQSAPQPASSLVPPVGKTAASLPTTTSTVQVPATVTSTDSGDLSACPPLPSVPLSFPIQKTNEKIIHTTANSLPSAAPSDSLPAYKSNTTSGSPSNGSGGPFPSTSAAVPPVSTILTPLPLFKPPACKNESPVPMWIGSPPPPPPPPVHTLPLVLSSGTPIINGVTDMDTTPPSHATIFRSPPNTMGSIIPLPPIQPHIPAMAPVFPGPPPPVVPFPVPIFNQPFGPVATPGTTFWSPNAQQQLASLPSPSGTGG
ncbi:nuclear pore-associated protein 1, partial [Tupaia chinensis]|uniref:nuclear pore-associated protein 1 n=1 Tax=Tupaia chinensis TaxID=246437 RepID=UPI000703E795